jgi:hypothetical protein
MAMIAACGCGRDRGHDADVADSEAIKAVHFELGIDDRVFVEAHSASSGHVREGRRGSPISAR